MNSGYYSDSPISDKQGDSFDRTRFAERIASMCQSQNAQSLIVGIYGRWGEGKSSLIRMVSDILPPEIVRIEFNPWLFKDEHQLTSAFLHTIAAALGECIESRKEQLNSIFADYHESLGLLEDIPTIGTWLKLRKALRIIKKPNPKISVKEAKQKIDDLIIRSGRNYVIFIDDIDRLDVKEIASTFKLVKLLCDFPRTTYVLSFDVDLVARMLAPQYGGIVPDSGYKFLEKIIQVPLSLPRPRSSTLKSYAQNLIQKVVDLNAIDDPRLESAFIDGILPVLTTPRSAVRLSNALNFSLPLVTGNVNVCDFLLLETIRASLPEFYIFIHENRYLFLDDYTDDQMNRYMSVREEGLKKINSAVKIYSEATKKVLNTLVCMLFPRFVWVSLDEIKGEDSEDWLRDRRICSPQYFDRYFTYSLEPGEISDVHLHTIYINVAERSIEELVSAFREDFKVHSVDDIIFKLVYHRKHIAGKAAENLALALVSVSMNFGKKEAFDFGGTFQLAALLVQDLIKNISLSNQEVIATRVIEQSSSLSFAAEMVARFVMPESDKMDDRLFVDSQAKNIKSIYVDRVRFLIQEKGFFSAIEEDKMIRFLVWWNDIDRYSLSEKINEQFEVDKSTPLKLLRIFTPTIHSTNGKEIKTFKSDFGIEHYERIDVMIGVKRLFYQLLSVYGDKSQLESINHIGSKDEIRDMELIGLFQRMYRERHPEVLGY